MSPLTPTSTPSCCKSSSSTTPVSSTPCSLDKSQTKSSPSLLSEFLSYPSPVNKGKARNFKGARVLTSVESRALLEEKERKKREENEAKELRRQERLEKKKIKEREQKRKQEERALKATQRGNNIKTRAARLKKGVSESSSKQGNPKGKRRTNERGLQTFEISSSECASCFGLYEDDINENGDITSEWIQCTNEECALWMHTHCLDASDGMFVCAVCQNTFK